MFASLLVDRSCVELFNIQVFYFFSALQHEVLLIQTPHSPDQLGAIGRLIGYEVTLKASAYLRSTLGLQKTNKKKRFQTTFNRAVLHETSLLYCGCLAQSDLLQPHSDLLNVATEVTAPSCVRRKTMPCRKRCLFTTPRRWRHNTVFL